MHLAARAPCGLRRLPDAASSGLRERPYPGVMDTARSGENTVAVPHRLVVPSMAAADTTLLDQVSAG